MLRVLGLGRIRREVRGLPARLCLLPLLFLLGASFLSDWAGAELCVPSAQGPCSSCHTILRAHLRQSTHFPLSAHPPPLKRRAGQQGGLMLICLGGGGGRDTFEPRPLPLPPSWPCWELMEPVEGRYRGCVTGVEPCYRVALLELKETRSVTQGAAGRGPRPSLLISGPATSWCSWPCCFWGLSCRLLLPGAVCAWAALGHPPDTPSRSLRFLRPGPTPLQLFSQSVFRTVELVIPRDRVSAAQDKLVASALLNTIHRPLS